MGTGVSWTKRDLSLGLLYAVRDLEEGDYDMNGCLLIAGTMIVCFADREFGSTTFTKVRVGFRYPVIGVVMIVAGLVYS